MIPTTTWRQILDGMVARLEPLRIGSATAAPAPVLRVVDWYAGEFGSKEALENSKWMGRTPAALCDFLGDRVLRTMAGGRLQLVETTVAVVCVSDSMRSREDRDRSALDQVAAAVRAQLHACRLALPIQGLHYTGLQPLVQVPGLVAYAVRFTTRHHIDPATQAPDAFEPLDRVTGTLHQVVGSLSVPLQTDLPQE